MIISVGPKRGHIHQKFGLLIRDKGREVLDFISLVGSGFQGTGARKIKLEPNANDYKITEVLS